ncbi:MAG: cob(I)yrinic acid a,c-diamide adenosyltransferase [Desulfosarcinaceae bacterium]
MQGYVQVYTGDGKGKTTAALGLTVRAVGAGLRVYIGQFLKRFDYSEILGLRDLGDRVTMAQYGNDCHVIGKPGPEDVVAAEKGLVQLKQALVSGDYDVVIADEANVACAFGLLTEQDLLDLIKLRPAHVELVLTGRKATAAVMAAADLVTEMKAVKHYFEHGVTARKGIES